MIPDNVEKIIMTKEDYDRNVEQLLFDKVSAELERDKYKEVLDNIKEYIKENTRYYDKELGLVEMMGAGETRTPVVYLYGFLELLEGIK